MQILLYAYTRRSILIYSVFCGLSFADVYRQNEYYQEGERYQPPQHHHNRKSRGRGETGPCLYEANDRTAAGYFPLGTGHIARCGGLGFENNPRLCG